MFKLRDIWGFITFCPIKVKAGRLLKSFVSSLNRHTIFWKCIFFSFGRRTFFLVNTKEMLSLYAWMFHSRECLYHQTSHGCMPLSISCSHSLSQCNNASVIYGRKKQLIKLRACLISVIKNIRIVRSLCQKVFNFFQKKKVFKIIFFKKPSNYLPFNGKWQPNLVIRILQSWGWIYISTF